LIVKKIGVKFYLLTILVWVLVLVVSARLLHTELPGYIGASLYYIKDYGEVMFLPLLGEFGKIAGWGAIGMWIIILFCFGWVLVRLVRGNEYARHRDTLFLYVFIGIALFVCYKSAYVRADGHVYHFFEMAPLLMIIPVLYTPPALGRKMVQGCAWTVLAVTFVVTNLLPGNMQTFRRLYSFTFLSIKVSEAGGYFSQLGSYDRALASADSLTRLPNRYREIIGHHTADILPTEISAIYFNGLNYAPRPTLQSYAAYDRYLDSLNSERYLSAAAPDYVLYTYDNSSERFAWADESRVKLAMLSRYRAAGEIDDKLLFKKRESPRRLIPSEEKTVHYRLGDTIRVKKGDGLLFAKVAIHYDWKGRLRNFLYQPPELKVSLTLENGQVKVYRALLPVLADGLILNKYVSDTRQFQLFMLSDGLLTPDVRAVKFEPADGQYGFAADVTLRTTWYRVADKPTEEAREDSLRLAAMFDGNRPRHALSLTLSDTADASLSATVDDFLEHDHLVRVTGWAYRRKTDSSETGLRAVLRCDDKLYEMLPDTPTAWGMMMSSKMEGMEGGPFAAMIDKSSLPPGYYDLGIAFVNRRTGKGQVKYLGLPVAVTPPGKLERLGYPVSGSAGGAPINYNIEAISRRGGQFVIEGWATLAGADPSTVTNLILRGDPGVFRINTVPKTRLDIVGATHTPAFVHAGFVATIPGASLPEGNYTIGIEKLSPAKKEMSRIFTDRILKTVRSGTVERVPAAGLPASGELQGNIDEVRNSAGNVVISGWGLHSPGEADKEGLRILLRQDSTVYMGATERISRHDLSGRFKEPAALSSGFTVSIPEDGLPVGRYRIGICIYRDGKAECAKFFDQTVLIE
jgi:hypothetical protein